MEADGFEDFRVTDPRKELTVASAQPANDAVSCDVSIVVPHYNDLRNLDICLDALIGQAVDPAMTVEIIVADNGSPCGLDAVQRTVAGRARVVLTDERGAGPARNAGVAAARGHVLAFIDSDCVAAPGWLRAGLAMLDHYDFVGGRVTVLVRSESRMNGVEAFERVFAFDNGAYITRKGFTGSGNLFCPATVFERVGPFRKIMSEDIEWSFRARDMGFRLGYAPDAIVGHPAREDWAALLGKWRRINREIYALRRDGGEPRWRWLLRTWLLPASIVPHAIKALRSPALSGVGNRMRAVATLAAHRFWRMWDQHRLMLEPAEKGGSAEDQARSPTSAT